MNILTSSTENNKIALTCRIQPEDLDRKHPNKLGEKFLFYKK
ncbi:hypothetical protein [Coxiella burnetii]|uniref:Uncharacterized protein n=1 Tax=Coxiella burnetii (strain RSA 493 / Nine Mile phase I) TaxID=227377 RepID=B5QSH9_COXBU|nr:hypothetical protein [Coxiella burnetii]YP_009351857.1 hypothetical protein CBUA0013a [Coxiella burnetii RSA 493]ABX77184.1 hypothetical protein COXBURSA331_0009 [Coxiella burnetii RSA 331]ACI14638.1 hypothetical protein CBUA0013a [Coxiella burnetii RSA 493]MCF2094097.1 hypothetical protein [Coxiella burnetii]MCF2096033.1 hypothetical protein [Coxiella burnetii]MCF2098060.1 hypothetical protein [Coxiella burnetii]